MQGDQLRGTGVTQQWEPSPEWKRWPYLQLKKQVDGGTTEARNSGRKKKHILYRLNISSTLAILSLKSLRELDGQHWGSGEKKNGQHWGSGTKNPGKC